MICVKCGTDISDSAKCCPKCGFKNAPGSTEKVALKICPQCGTENRAAARYCKMDGAFLEGPHTDAVSVDEKAHEPKPLTKEQSIVPPQKNHCIPETSSSSTNEEKRTDYQEPLSEKSVAFSSVGNTENSSTKSHKENDDLLEESTDYKQHTATTAQLSSPYYKEKGLDQSEQKVEGDKRRGKLFLITISFIGCCFLLGAFGYYYRDHLMPSSQTPSNVSVQPPTTQLEKQTPVPSRQPDQSIRSQPVPEKTPEKSKEVKLIVNKRTQPELKPNKDEDVKPIVNKQLRPELKPISPAVSTQKTPVKIRTIPNGARIYIDGQPRATAPATLMMSQGNHKIRVSREGYKDAETKLNVQETMEFPIHISLEPSE